MRGGRTGTPVRRVAAVAVGVRSEAMEQGNDHHCDVALTGMLMYENNLRNIMVLSAANNAKPCVEIVIPS